MVTFRESACSMNRAEKKKKKSLKSTELRHAVIQLYFILKSLNVSSSIRVVACRSAPESLDILTSLVVVKQWENLCRPCLSQPSQLSQAAEAHTVTVKADRSTDQV